MTIVYIILVIAALLVVRHVILKSSIKKAAKKLSQKPVTPFIQEVKKIVDSDDLSNLIRVCSDANEKQQKELARFFDGDSLPILERWSKMEAKSARALYFMAMSLHSLAAHARTGKWADELSTEEVDGFEYYISRAEQALLKAQKLDPSYLPVYESLIAIYLALGKRDKAWVNYARAYQLNPTKVGYHEIMMTTLSSKWGGSTQEKFSFARDVVKKHPHTGLVGLIASAHIEEWSYLGACNEINKFSNYFHQDEVKVDINEAYEDLPKDSDVQDKQEDHLYALNHLALCFVEMKDKAKAKEMFEKIGSNYTTMPWKLLGGNPAESFLENRRKAGLGYQF